MKAQIIYDIDKLPEWVDKSDLSNNGAGKEYASYIVIEHGEYKQVFSDAMEPEDCRFSRDLNWIVGEIQRAYEFGLKENKI